MASYGVIRIEKYNVSSVTHISNHALRIENDGKLKTHSNKDIDRKRRNENNFIVPSIARLQKLTADEINDRISENAIRDAIEKRIADANDELAVQSKGKVRKIRRRKDSVVMFEVLIDVSKTWNADEKTKKEYFKKAVNFCYNRFGKGNLLYIADHNDENHRHIHLGFVPITDDLRLSAKALLGEKEGLHQLQEDFYSQVCQQFGLDHCDTTSKKKHLSVNDYKKRKEAEEELEKIKKQIENVRDEYNNIVNEIIEIFDSDLDIQIKRINEFLENREKVRLMNENAKMALEKIVCRYNRFSIQNNELEAEQCTCQ